MQQKNRRGLRQNLIFAALVLALAAGLALWRQATAAPAPVAQLNCRTGPSGLWIPPARTICVRISAG